MMISTKGRYALRVMVDLYDHESFNYIPLKDIAERQEISLKYLESIMTILSKAKFVDATHGIGGGYKLNRIASDYTVGSILKLTEKSLAPVACLDKGYDCTRGNTCKTLPMWEGLNQVIDTYLESINLQQLAESAIGFNYMI